MSARTSLDLSLGPSGHVDDFTRRNLPPFDQWPELVLDRPEFRYPEYLNAAVELTDRLVEKGLGDQRECNANRGGMIRLRPWEKRGFLPVATTRKPA